MDNFTQNPSKDLYNKDHKTLALASLVLGIISLSPLSSFFVILLSSTIPNLDSYGSGVFSLIGIILGVKGLKSSRKTISIIGIVLSIMGLILPFFLLIVSLFYYD